VRGHLAALQAYRAGLVEKQRRADLWELEMVGVIEALTALQDTIRDGIDWETRRAVVELLVKEIVIETKHPEGGRSYPIAHVTYRFEQPTPEIPTPIELEPLFSGLDVTKTPSCTILNLSGGGNRYDRTHSTQKVPTAGLWWVLCASGSVLAPRVGPSHSQDFPPITAAIEDTDTHHHFLHAAADRSGGKLQRLAIHVQRSRRM
jgi:hypothetical protein